MGRFLLVMFLLMVFAPAALATEEYAQATGRPCAECHADPAGGGALTPLGSDFALGGHKWPIEATAKAKTQTFAMRSLRLLLGFLHLLAGVAWLGTIFYVHIVLKPSYAKGGLPKMEMRIAWASMAILAATGVPLTLMRFHHPSALLQSRSGMLLLVKIGIFLFLVFSAAFVVFMLNPRLKARKSSWQLNDGLEGRPAWVKVGDTLYDVTESKRWKEGNHFGRHQAGADMTEALKGAPHKIDKLSGFPAFSLADQSLDKENSAVRTLFVMAYVNLFAALGVVMVIALWRWG